MKKYTTPYVCTFLLLVAVACALVAEGCKAKIQRHPPLPFEQTNQLSPTVALRMRMSVIPVAPTTNPAPTYLVMQIGVDPRNGTPGYADIYTVIETTADGGKTWSMADKVWGTTNYWTNRINTNGASHLFRTRWSPTNIVIHPL